MASPVNTEMSWTGHKEVSIFRGLDTKAVRYQNMHSSIKTIQNRGLVWCACLFGVKVMQQKGAFYTHFNKNVTKHNKLKLWPKTWCVWLRLYSSRSRTDTSRASHTSTVSQNTSELWVVVWKWLPLPFAFWCVCLKEVLITLITVHLMHTAATHKHI